MATFFRIIGIAVLIFIIDYFLWAMLLSSFPCLGPDCIGDETSVFHTAVTVVFMVFTFPGGALLSAGLLDGLLGMVIGFIIVANVLVRAIAVYAVREWIERRNQRKADPSNP